MSLHPVGCTGGPPNANEFFFLQNCKNTEMKKLAFCITTFEPIKITTCKAPQNDRLILSFVIDCHIVGKQMA